MPEALKTKESAAKEPLHTDLFEQLDTSNQQSVLKYLEGVAAELEYDQFGHFNSGEPGFNNGTIYLDKGRGILRIKKEEVGAFIPFTDGLGISKVYEYNVNTGTLTAGYKFDFHTGAGHTGRVEFDKDNFLNQLSQIPEDVLSQSKKDQYRDAVFEWIELLENDKTAGNSPKGDEVKDKILIAIESLKAQEDTIAPRDTKDTIGVFDRRVQEYIKIKEAQKKARQSFGSLRADINIIA